MVETYLRLCARLNFEGYSNSVASIAEEAGVRIFNYGDRKVTFELQNDGSFVINETALSFTELGMIYIDGINRGAWYEGICKRR